MKQKKIRIGLDFDGVVAYNPARIIRAPITYIKRRIIGIRKLKFYIPKTPFERFVWAILHESSLFPSIGAQRLRDMVKDERYEFYLVSARFGYLQPNLFRWLDRYGMRTIFSGIHINHENKQPHMHKFETINSLRLDYYIEDNWDIVEYLNKNIARVKIFWIYNVADRCVQYDEKYPYLDKALKRISELERV